jgi:hypothetical protein
MLKSLRLLALGPFLNVREWRGKWRRRKLRNRVMKALAPAPRGAIANDRLRLRKTSLSLKVEWQARDVHPWDCDLPAWRKTEVFTVGLISDTVAAIRQAFDDLAEADTIQIRVVHPNEPDRTLLAGTVRRDDLNTALGSASPAMSLMLLGVKTPSACDSGEW